MKKSISILFSILTILFLISCGSGAGTAGGGGSNGGNGGIEAESGVLIKVNAQEPVITGNPQGGKYKAIVDGKTIATSHTMTVTAEVTDGGTLSYEWYRSDTNKKDDALATKLAGTSASINDSIAAGEDKSSFTYYYYCKITNTISDNGDGGTKTVSVYSDIAEVYFGTEDVAAIPSVGQLVGYYDEEPANDIELTITASTTDGGTLSYEWFSSSTIDGSFSAIANATEATLTLNKEAAKEKKYYYVEVTNTKDGLTQTAVSNKVLVQNLTGSLGYLHPSKYLPQEKYSPVNMDSWAAANYELGAFVENDGTTIAVYSENATRMLLEIYEASGTSETLVADYWMEKGSDNIWRAKVNGLENGHIYAFRAWGPNWPFSEEWKRGNSSEGFIADYDSKGNRFNPNKVLFDPYAKEMTHDRSTRTGSSGVGIFTSGKDNRHKDTASVAPKGYVIEESVEVVTETKPNTPLKDSIIYEAHVRGITKHPSSANLETILQGIDGFENVVNIPAEYQGTYKGAGMLAPYLKALGITAIELLPIHESDNDSNPSTTSGGNYWAYMTYGYFAPDRRYSSDKTPGGPTKEFKNMVKAFHEVGIEVYLDVVFNHSGEGGTWNGNKDDFQKAELNFMRGLDNANWYCLVPSEIGAYWETTGCGNNLQCDNEMVRQFILDSLTYWIDEMGVDGFRFDLAPVLGREFNGTDWPLKTDADTLKDIAKLGKDSSVKMIAEAWDAGGGYAVGDFPTGWADWNGKYRDEVRKFLKNDGTGNITKHIAGSEEMYSDVGGPHNSINFIVAHDGLTLTDLVSFPIYSKEAKEKHNKQAWPFGPSDGGSDGNDCWDSTGLESKTWFKEGGYNTQAFRRQRLRNFWVLQMFSRGVPMIVWGDEYGRTQNGNNNPYNVDSVATWSNYNMINTDAPHTVSTGGGGKYTNSLGTDALHDEKNNIFLFSSKLMNFRLSEELLCQDDYSSVEYIFTDKTGGTAKPGDKNSDILFSIKAASASNPEYAVCICRNEDSAQTFSLPSPGNGFVWAKFIDTSYAAEAVGNIYTETTTSATPLQVQVPPQAIVVYKAVEASGVTYVAAPTISADADIYNYLDPITVTITCETTGATIYYSLDGEEFTTYSAPFKLPTSVGTHVITAYGKVNEMSIPTYSSKEFTATEANVVKVYFDNSITNWSKVACYQWGDNPLCDWPGIEMDLKDGKIYELTIPLNYGNIIFNNGAGSQTEDLTIPSIAELQAGKVLFVPSTKNSEGKWTGTWQIPSF